MTLSKKVVVTQKQIALDMMRVNKVGMLEISKATGLSEYNTRNIINTLLKHKTIKIVAFEIVGRNKRRLYGLVNKKQ